MSNCSHGDTQTSDGSLVLSKTDKLLERWVGLPQGHPNQEAKSSQRSRAPRRGWPGQPIRRKDHLGSVGLKFEFWVFTVSGPVV